MSKQVIVLRKDLNMTKGKMVAQGSHASMGVLLHKMNNGKSVREEKPPIKDDHYHLTLSVEVDSPMDRWLSVDFKKICVYVKSEEELMDIFNQAVERRLPVCLIEDNGLTMFKGIKTRTCLAIGPYDDDAINAVTGHLPLL